MVVTLVKLLFVLSNGGGLAVIRNVARCSGLPYVLYVFHLRYTFTSTSAFAKGELFS
jgi:hypothetical protein